MVFYIANAVSSSQPWPRWFHRGKEGVCKEQCKEHSVLQGHSGHCLTEYLHMVLFGHIALWWLCGLFWTSLAPKISEKSKMGAQSEHQPDKGRCISGQHCLRKAWVSKQWSLNILSISTLLSHASACWVTCWSVLVYASYLPSRKQDDVLGEIEVFKSESPVPQSL